VNTRIIEVRRGRDGKLYPPRMPLPIEQRERLRRLAHNLVCRDQLSIREAQRTMLESYTCRRSIGSICRDLKRFECPQCAAPEPPAPPAVQEQPSAAVHSRPGGLTDMLAGGG
jgi:hypothetical protein